MQFSIAGQPVHPHIKLTNEDFPRPLATRILRDDGDEYFGAFLSRTNVRILIDFLNRTFRLRSCAIEIDGSFPVPCTQSYAKRCVAPCVASLCARERYLELMANPVEVDGILEMGADRLRPIAEATMAEVRQRMGLR